MDAKKKKKLYEYYKKAGYKLKVYDYPIVYTAGGKRHLREFDIEELLFRKPSHGRRRLDWKRVMPSAGKDEAKADHYSGYL